MTGTKQGTGGNGMRGRWAGTLDRLALVRARRARPATGFTRHPEPRTIGAFARGRQLVAGNFLFAGIALLLMLVHGAQQRFQAAFEDVFKAVEVRGVLHAALQIVDVFAQKIVA